MWGRHPQLSYLDHPPLHAWLMGAVRHDPGLVAILTARPDLADAGRGACDRWAIAGRLAPDNRTHLFWKTAAIYVSLPHGRGDDAGVP